jgi:hypothetical protein
MVEFDGDKGPFSNLHTRTVRPVLSTIESNRRLFSYIIRLHYIIANNGEQQKLLNAPHRTMSGSKFLYILIYLLTILLYVTTSHTSSIVWSNYNYNNKSRKGHNCEVGLTRSGVILIKRTIYKHQLTQIK